MPEKTRFNKSAIRLLLCIICAFCLWLYVSYVENPDMTRRITNIPITVVGETKLNENNLAVKDLSTSTVDIKIRAKRNLFTNLTSETIKATADVSAITQEGEAHLTVNITYPSSASNIQITDRSKLDIIAHIEEYVTQTFTIKPVISKNPSNGYYVNSQTLSNGEAMVLSASGCASDIAKIHHITTQEIDLSDAIENRIVPLSFTAVDENMIPVENITLSSKRANSTFEIYKEAAIPLEVEIAGDDEAIKYEMNPTAIYVKGPATIVDSIQPIKITTLNEFNFNPDDKISFEIPIPEGVTLRDSETAIVDIKFLNAQ